MSFFGFRLAGKGATMRNFLIIGITTVLVPALIWSVVAEAKNNRDQHRSFAITKKTKDAPKTPPKSSTSRVPKSNLDSGFQRRLR